MGTDSKTGKSASYLTGESMLPPKLYPLYERMVNEYKFAAYKHHGTGFVSGKVIAELILMGWTSPPGQEHRE
jgi:hypothetical protein